MKKIKQLLKHWFYYKFKPNEDSLIVLFLNSATITIYCISYVVNQTALKSKTLISL